MANITVQDTVQSAMAEVFTRASEGTISGIENIEKKDGSIVPKKEYTFINPIGKRTTMTTYDNKVIAATEKIAMALYGKKVLNFAICREMANLNTKEILDSMGFSTISEYGKALFDFSRVTSNQYARIGDIFIDEKYKLKSTILPSSLQKGHLVELLAYVGEDNDISDIEELYLDGTLTDGMSTAKMRATLKDWKNGTLAIEGDSKEIPEIEEKSNSTESQDKGVSQLTNNASTTSSNTDVKKNHFDVQVEVGKIISMANNIEDIFDFLNKHYITVLGYDKLLDNIKALAESLLNMTD